MCNKVTFILYNMAIKKIINSDQRKIVDSVVSSLANKCTSNIFYVDGPGGTVKTFVFETLIHYCRGLGINVIGMPTIVWIICSKT